MNMFPLSKTIEGYLLSLGARHLSQNTIDDYTRTLSKFSVFLEDDLPVNEITTRDIEGFLSINPALSNKSILNQYIGLSALWTWMVSEKFVSANVVRGLTPPKAEQKDIVPLNEKEVKAIVSALNKSRVYVRQGQNIDHALGSCDRNHAILMLLLDTGIRASELCDLRMEDLDNRNNRITIRLGKGMKSRTLPFSPRTGQAIWRYLATRADAQPDDPLFLSKLNHAMTRTKLAEMFHNIGERAGVKNVHPHRFRHTFAIQYLRNGGNAYTLQAMLGHASLETVKIYLRLAQVDLDTMHRHASPVAGWRL